MCRACRRRSTTGQKAAVVIVAALAAAGAQGAVKHAATSAATVSAPTRAAAVAIRYAEARRGLPYCWGGTGPSCYDCSGLVMQAYAAAGIPIPRTSQEQWANLPHVSRSRLLPGDLVFAAGADGTVASPGHVVMYIGHGKVIQAYATGYPVMISSLASVNAAGLTGYARPGGA